MCGPGAQASLSWKESFSKLLVSFLGNVLKQREGSQGVFKDSPGGWSHDNHIIQTSQGRGTAREERGVRAGAGQMVPSVYICSEEGSIRKGKWSRRETEKVDGEVGRRLLG